MKKRFLVPLGIGVLCVFAAAFRYFVIHVVTPSIPMGWYFVQRWAQPARGEYVVICAPAPVVEIGKARGYLIPGDCPGKVSPMVKRIVAADGDMVALSDRGFFVNDKRIADGPQHRDSLGRPLQSVPAKTYRVNADDVWLLGDAAKSWDSRYFGPFSRHAIIGLAKPMLTQPFPQNTSTPAPLGGSHE